MPGVWTAGRVGCQTQPVARAARFSFTSKTSSSAPSSGKSASRRRARGDPLVLARDGAGAVSPPCSWGGGSRGVTRRGHFMRFALEGDLVPRRQRHARGGATSCSGPRGGRGAAKKEFPLSLGLALVFEGRAPSCSTSTTDAWARSTSATVADEAKIPVYGKLGIDPTSPAFHARRPSARLIKKRARSGAHVSSWDKSAIASVGNAYADEILFAARLATRRPSATSSRPAEIDALLRGDPARAHGRAGRRDPAARRAPSTSRCVTSWPWRRGATANPVPVCGTVIRARAASATATPASVRRCQPPGAQSSSSIGASCPRGALSA